MWVKRQDSDVVQADSRGRERNRRYLIQVSERVPEAAQDASPDPSPVPDAAATPAALDVPAVCPPASTVDWRQSSQSPPREVITSGRVSKPNPRRINEQFIH